MDDPDELERLDGTENPDGPEGGEDPADRMGRRSDGPAEPHGADGR